MHLKKLDSMRNLAKKMKELAHPRKKVQYKALCRDSSPQAEYLQRKGSYCSRDVPEGYLAVYIGKERRRFVIPTVYLSHPVFLKLLDKAHEEYGFTQKEGLAVPCDVEVFEQSLWLIECSQSASREFDLETLANKFTLKAPLGSDE